MRQIILYTYPLGPAWFIGGSIRGAGDTSSEVPVFVALSLLKIQWHHYQNCRPLQTPIIHLFPNYNLDDQLQPDHYIQKMIFTKKLKFSKLHKLIFYIIYNAHSYVITIKLNN